MSLKDTVWAKDTFHIVAPGQAYSRKRSISEDNAAAGKTRRRIEDIEEELRLKREFEL